MGAFSRPLSASLAGRRLCLTGNLSLDRDSVVELLEHAGAQVTGAVSGLTEFLIVGEDPGRRKLADAASHRTPLIGEREMWDLLELEPLQPSLRHRISPASPRPAVAHPTAISEPVYAVVDVETSAGYHDARVCEIAIVSVTASGEIVDEYGTLIDPEGPVGYSRIHGITPAAVQGAPTWAEIAGDVSTRLGGAVFVAHNAGFDAGMIRREYARMSHELPPLTELCTVRLARRLRLHPGRANLAACCRHFGIEMERHHAALSDARATAQLLSIFLEDARQRGHTLLKHIDVTERLAGPQEWPQLAPLGHVQLRRGQALPGAVCLEPLESLGDYRDLDDLDVVREPVIDVL